MAEMEKMEALKRAYAETILNTAKEAAARVMAAELKARRMEQDLVATKEEASRMLLRLKQMIDAKTKEAEIASANQQRKCDELESQLNEAEGIILDLRVELNLAHEQLEELKCKKVLSVKQNENAEVSNVIPNGACIDNELLKSSLSLGPECVCVDAYNSCSERRSLDQECRAPSEHAIKFATKYEVCSGDDRPILDEIKEPELLRNGCTQRICAAETSLLREKLPVGDESNPSNQSTKSDTKKAVDSSVLEEKDQQVKNEAVSVVRRSVRKRKLKFWDDVIAACGLHRRHQSTKPRHAFSFDNTGKVIRCEIPGKKPPQEFSFDKTGKVIRCEKPGGGLPQAGHETQVEDILDRSQCYKKELAHKDCDAEGGTSTNASDLSLADGEKPLKYTFTRKWKRKSVIFPKESSSFERNLSLSEENGNSARENSSLPTKSYGDSSQLMQVAHQLIALSGSVAGNSHEAQEI